jgi:tetratricopeptide (TPR) repeat protein
MTYLLRGSIFRDMRKYDNAIADYSQVIRLAPNDAEGWRNRGLIWLQKYDDDRGIADYDQAIRLDPNDAVSYNNRGQAHLSKGHREQAIADFRKALELQPGQLNAVQGLKRLGLDEAGPIVIDTRSGIPEIACPSGQVTEPCR